MLFRLPTVKIEDVTELDEQTQQERKKDFLFCLGMCIIVVIGKAWLQYQVNNRCACLLLCPEVWLAKAKIGQVERTIKTLLGTCKADNQLKASLTETGHSATGLCIVYVCIC